MLHDEPTRRTLLAGAMNIAARKVPADTRLNFSQGAVTLAELAGEIKSGKPRGVTFFREFEDARLGRHQPFFQAVEDLVEHPPTDRRPSSPPPKAT